MEISVVAAAAELRLDPRRVRRLLTSGALPGRKLGHGWLIPEEAVHNRARVVHRPGRPFSPTRAWAAVAELAGVRVDWVDSSARAQVRAVLARRSDADADQWAALLRNLAEVQHMRARSSQVVRLMAEPEVCDSALPAASLSLAVSHEVPSVFVGSSTWPVVADRLLIGTNSLATGGQPVDIVLVPDAAFAVLATEPSLRDAAAIALAASSREPRVRAAAASWLSTAAASIANRRRARQVRSQQ